MVFLDFLFPVDEFALELHESRLSLLLHRLELAGPFSELHFEFLESSSDLFGELLASFLFSDEHQTLMELSHLVLE